MKKSIVTLALGCALAAGTLWTTPAQAGTWNQYVRLFSQGDLCKA